MDKLSIIICAFNKWPFTENCIRDLAFLDPALNEIILFDNGSSDQTQQEVQKWVKKLSNLRYIRSETNWGFAGGNNRAYRESTGNIVLFLNNDIRVSSQHAIWTDDVIQAVKENPNALVGPTMGQLDHNLHFVREAKELLPGHSYMSGWCLAANKETLSKIDVEKKGHVFSEDFFAFFEDVDLSFRAKALGYDFKLIEVPVVHFGHITAKSQFNISTLYKTSRETFLTKWSKLIKSN